MQRGRKSKYDTVIKPNWDKIEEMLKNGMDEKAFGQFVQRHFDQIYKMIGMKF